MMVITLLFSVVVMVSLSSAKDYNCTTKSSVCSSRGAQIVTVNGIKVCCSESDTLTLANNRCTCVAPTPPAGDIPCMTGIPQCRQAASISTDSKGQIRCCAAGYSINSVISSNVNGHVLDFCTCAKGINGGFLSSVLGLNNGGGVNSMSSSRGQGPYFAPFVPAGGDSRNASDALNEWRRMGDNFRNWGQQFGQDFRSWGHNFAQSMRSTGLDLARGLQGTLQSTLTHTIVPIRRAVNNMFANMFGPMPRF